MQTIRAIWLNRSVRACAALFLIVVFVAACATQPVPRAFDPPGLFSGIFHGATVLPALFASMLTDVRIYAFPNTGFFYDLGFVFGLFIQLIILIVALSR